MAVARITEISATSAQSFEDAIRQGLERAISSLRGVTGAWIKDQRVKLDNGRIAEYQVNMEVTFVLKASLPAISCRRRTLGREACRELGRGRANLPECLGRGREQLQAEIKQVGIPFIPPIRGDWRISWV